MRGAARTLPDPAAPSLLHLTPHYTMKPKIPRPPIVLVLRKGPAELILRYTTAPGGLWSMAESPSDNWPPSADAAAVAAKRAFVESVTAWLAGAEWDEGQPALDAADAAGLAAMMLW